tara:strand:- start:5557 stop:6567 length:1011 start_codon:yes stop_codon:yes gene_type:complete
MKKLITIFLFLIVSMTIYVNYNMVISSHYSGFLLNDYNSNNLRLPFEVVVDIKDNLPNISTTTIPIKSLKARYYQANDSIEKAIDLYREAIQDNPFIKQPEAELAKLYFNEKLYDSSYYYASNAFRALPNNNVHRDIYFKNLVQKKDTMELRSAFNILQTYNNANHWIDYAVSRYNIVGSNDKESVSVMEELLEKYPIYINDPKYESLLSILKVGNGNIGASVRMNQAGMNFYNEQLYGAAIDHFEFAINYDPNDYIFYENLAMAHNMQTNYKDAITNFDKVIYEFRPGNGKAEYLKGLMLIKLDSLVKGCNYLKKASDLRFAEESSKIVYKRFCD